MTRGEMKTGFMIISMIDPKAKFATEEKLAELQIDTWLSFVGEYDFKTFQRAVKVHYSETSWPPGPADIMKIVQRLEGEERRKIALAEAEREKLEYKHRLEIKVEEVKKLQARPDYNELRMDFVEKFTKRFPLTRFIEEEPEAVDANILFQITNGFYHFEHTERGLIETDDKKMIAAPVKFLPKAESPFRRLEPPIIAEREETEEEKLIRENEEIKTKWKAIQVRKRSVGSMKSIVEIVEEVAKEAEFKFSLEVE